MSGKIKHVIKITDDINVNVELPVEMKYEEFIVIANQLEKMFNPFIKQQMTLDEVPMSNTNSVIEDDQTIKFGGHTFRKDNKIWKKMPLIMQYKNETGCNLRKAFIHILHRPSQGADYNIANAYIKMHSQKPEQTKSEMDTSDYDKKFDRVKSVMDKKGVSFMKAFKLVYKRLPSGQEYGEGRAYIIKNQQVK